MVRYPAMAIFGKLILERLERDNKSLYQLAEHLGETKSLMSSIFKGECTIRCTSEFDRIDRFFGSTQGYYRSVYDNCIKSQEVIDKQDKPDMITIPVDMLQSLYDIACEHGYPMFDVCEALTKHKKENV